MQYKLAFLGSREQSKGALFYIGPYICKNLVQIVDLFDLIIEAQEHGTKYPSVADDSGTQKRYTARRKLDGALDGKKKVVSPPHPIQRKFPHPHPLQVVTLRFRSKVPSSFFLFLRIAWPAPTSPPTPDPPSNMPSKRYVFSTLCESFSQGTQVRKTSFEEDLWVVLSRRVNILPDYRVPV